MMVDARVALVTGASSGLGAAIADELSRAGWRVYGASRRPAGSSLIHGSLRMDVDEDGSVDAAVAELVSREGRLDVVVCNAGMGIAGPLEETTSAEALAQFQTNFFGTHRVCRAALPHLRQRQGSRIVVVGSLAGRIALPYQGMYSASKFALEGYCESLRMELRRSGVEVALVEPGDFATGFTAARRTVRSIGRFHADAFARAMDVITQDELNGCDPALLARAVRRLIDTDRPALRHPVGAWLQTAVVRARAVIPADWLERLVRGHYRC